MLVIGTFIDFHILELLYFIIRHGALEADLDSMHMR